MNLLALLLAAGLVVVAHTDETAARERKACLAVAEAYQRNRDAFSDFSCRFIVKKFRVKRLEDASRADLPLYLESTGLWLKSGVKQKYSLLVNQKVFEELMFHPDNVVTTGQRFYTEAPMEQIASLDDGKYQLIHDRLIKFALIHDPASRRDAVKFSPLSGLYQSEKSNFVDQLRKQLANGARCRVTEGDFSG